MTELRVGAVTDVGRVRETNQDALLLGEGLFVVADGMGGHNGGEVASTLAIEVLGVKQGFTSTDELVEAIQEANLAVVDRADEDASLMGMGTTLVALTLVSIDGEDRILVANVGDSRCYLHDGAKLEQLTKDHSVVQTLVDNGRITAAEAGQHPQRNVLTRALGIDDRVMADTWELRPVVGDRFLLCSDGLHGEVSDHEITDVLRSGADPEEAANELVRLANEAGGHDNITAIVVDVVEGEPPPSDGAGRVLDATLGESWAIRAASEMTAVRPSSTAGADRDGDGDARPEDEEASSVSRGPSRGEGPEEARELTEGAGTPAGVGSATVSRRTREGGPPSFRTLLFVVVVLGILLGVMGVVFVSARSTYYVGFEGSEVVIFRGRPGGVLWLDPTVEESTGIEREEVPASYLDELEGGRSSGASPRPRSTWIGSERRAGALPPGSRRTTRRTPPPPPLRRHPAPNPTDRDLGSPSEHRAGADPAQHSRDRGRVRAGLSRLDGLSPGEHRAVPVGGARSARGRTSGQSPPRP